MSRPRHERILCIGLNYAGTSLRLEGCHRDAAAYFQYFNSRLVSNSRNTILWKDDPAPITATGILRALDWLLSSAPVERLLDPKVQSFEKWPILAYTNIYFAFAGHGTTIRGRVDNGDQSLVTRSGYVTDDQINDLLFKRMKSTTRFMGCVDCCSSGTIADLKYILSGGNIIKTDNNHNIHRNIPGLVQFFSACQDYKYAGEVDTGGVFTYSLLKHLATPNLPLGFLMDKVNSDLEIWGQKANLTSNKNPINSKSIL